MQGRWLALAGLVLTLLGSAAIWQGIHKTPAPAGAPIGAIQSATEIRDGHALPAFRLTGARGEITNATLQGHWSFVFFGYTQCPDICPTALGLMKALKSNLNAVSPASTFQVLFVSVDPARDSPDLLRHYLAAFDPAFIGASADDAALKPLTQALGVYFKRHDATDKKHYTVDHTASIYLIDPQTRLAAVFTPPQDAARMGADFQRLRTK